MEISLHYVGGFTPYISVFYAMYFIYIAFLFEKNCQETPWKSVTL